MSHRSRSAILAFVVLAFTSRVDAAVDPRVAPQGFPSVTVLSVVPPSGPTTGGTNVVITGSGFSSGIGAFVTFGGTAATNVVVVNDTTITATTPAHAAGPVDVQVSVDKGATDTLPNGFTYVAPGAADDIPTVSPLALFALAAILAGIALLRSGHYR